MQYASLANPVEWGIDGDIVPPRWANTIIVDAVNGKVLWTEPADSLLRQPLLWPAVVHDLLKGNRR
jgi:hypothetical protein